jgi:chromosome segregation ATPase
MDIKEYEKSIEKFKELDGRIKSCEVKIKDKERELKTLTDAIEAMKSNYEVLSAKHKDIKQAVNTETQAVSKIRVERKDIEKGCANIKDIIASESKKLEEMTEKIMSDSKDISDRLRSVKEREEKVSKRESVVKQLSDDMNRLSVILKDKQESIEKSTVYAKDQLEKSIAIKNEADGIKQNAKNMIMFAIKEKQAELDAKLKKCVDEQKSLNENQVKCSALRVKLDSALVDVEVREKEANSVKASFENMKKSLELEEKSLTIRELKLKEFSRQKGIEDEYNRLTKDVK